MELSQLRYFYVAAQHEHITKAAQELHIAQPALTQAIQRLERELGVPLFERKGRGITLNAYGTLLKKRLTEVFLILDQLPHEMKEISQQREKNIRFNVQAASTLMVELLIAYKKLHPEVNFQLVQNTGEDHSCDLCVTTVPSGLEDAQEEGLILTEQICLAVPVSCAYAKRSSLHLEEVMNESFISLSHEKPLRSICDRICMSIGFLPRIIFETENPTVFRDMIGAGLGVGFWPVHSWGTLASKEVTLVPLDNPFCKRDIIVQRLKPEAELGWYANDFYQFIFHHFQSLHES
ncbi:MAG: LysR family transcriptional regulator [Lachnospiraceae bacterium]|jgi:LysR family transcriptional activator of glutamate synthase operon|nr:LysR family transcriptional regulator [Lachnospiraceae bacterium]